MDRLMRMHEQVARGGKQETIIAARLRAARMAVGISQQELGVRAGMDVSVASPRVNQYEQGKHTPNTTTLTQFGAVLNVPLAYFFADSVELAELITVYHRASEVEQRRWLAVLKASPSS